MTAAVSTHASASPRPLRSASTVRAARSLRTPAAGAHRGPLLRRPPSAVPARRGAAECIVRPMCPRSRGEIARSRRAERLAQVAHCPRGNALPGEIALSARRGSRSGSAQAGHARPWPWRADFTLSAARRRIQASMRFRLRASCELHPPAYPCKGDRHSINAMYHCKGSLW